MSKLSDEEIREALADLPGWSHENGELSKEFKLATFMDAIAFIDRIAERADEIDHHPDLYNHYNKVRVGLHTWADNAVTEKDLKLAHHIEQLAESGF